MLFRIILLLISACFFCCSEAAESTSTKKTICLNMIVKNESQVIESCLASVKPWIDYWVIVDTGSEDDTREIIKNFMKDIPGELHERPWINFAHNRNEALSLAKNKGDYVLLIDADEVLHAPKDFSLPVLEKDIYLIPVRQIGVAEGRRNGLINHRLDWTWEGILHEDLYSLQVESAEILKGVFILSNTHGDGASGRSKESQIVKYRRDAEVLEKALQEEPDNSRYVYYLAVSYMGLGQYELAKKNFERRLALPSEDWHETYLTMYNLGCVQAELGDLENALESFDEAYIFHPVRAEPLVQSARIYQQKGNFLLAYLLSKHALKQPFPEDDAFVEYLIYDYIRLIEFVNCAIAFDKYKEALDGCVELLANPNFPSEYRPSTLSTYEFARKQLELGYP